MLHDHFRPPLDSIRHWEGFHATWPVMMVALLRHKLPGGYFAEPRVHSGTSAEIDVATFDNDDGGSLTSGGNGGVATALWAPPHPTLSIATSLPAQDRYEVLVYDQKRNCRLVAAVEIVSPANKDRPESRQAFVAKCVTLLGERVSIVIVDVVTTREHKVYVDLLEAIGHSGVAAHPAPALYASACRLTRRSDWLLETWVQPLTIGEELPTMPLWLADDLAVPLELNEGYERSCEILGIS